MGGPHVGCRLKLLSVDIFDLCRLSVVGKSQLILLPVFT